MKPYQPSQLPLENLDYQRLFALVGDANAELARYDGLLQDIFNRPIFKTTDFVNETGIHKPTAMGLLRQLINAGVLSELKAGSGRRAAVLCFSQLINIAEGKAVV